MPTFPLLCRDCKWVYLNTSAFGLRAGELASCRAPQNIKEDPAFLTGFPNPTQYHWQLCVGARTALVTACTPLALWFQPAEVPTPT